MRNIIIDLKNSDTWEVQLTIAINCNSSNDTEKERVMHSSNKDIKCTSYSNANKVIAELFESLCSWYQGNLETLMRRSDFIFDLVQLFIKNVKKYILGVVVHILVLRTG